MVGSLGRRLAGEPELNNVRGAASEAGAWFVVGLLNAVFVGLLARAPGEGVRVGVQLIDLGHFGLLGLASGLVRWLIDSAFVRFERPRLAATLTLWPLLSLLGYWVFKEDLSNFLDRMHVPAWLPARALAATTLAAAYLAFRQLTRPAFGAVLPWVAVGGAFALVAANNLALPVDYPGAHLLVAACAARLAEPGVAYLVSRASTAGRALPALVLALALPIPAVALANETPALRRLLRVPGSVVPPLLLPLLGHDSALGASWTRTQFPEWFRIGPQAPAIPPSGARLLAKDSIVIFLTIDALRADVVASGEHDDTLPELAELREQSLRFTRARSPSPSTLTTVSSIFSGRYYSQLYWVKEGNSVLPKLDQTPRWPALLTANQIHTAHVVSVRGVSARTGVGVGFETEIGTRRDYGPAREVMDHLLDQVGKLRASPGFLYAHFVDPHAPYTLGGRKGSQFQRYLAEVALVDQQLGRLRQYLSDHRLADRAFLIVSADHGEAFGEHGLSHHAQSVYDELLHVPLLLHSPKLSARSIDVPVTLLDLGPTLLDLFGLPTPGDLMGQSLVPLLLGQPFKAQRPIVADSGRRMQALVFPDGVKAIRDLHRNTQEVYDLRRDPGELRDLSDDPEFPARRYSAGLAAFFEQYTLKRPGWEPPWRKF